MLPLVSVFFFISVPSVSALEFCEEKTGYFYYNNGVENKACNSFNDLEVCEYSLGKGRKYASGSSEQFKKEALIRNLSNTDCRVLLGLNKPEKIKKNYVPNLAAREFTFCQNKNGYPPYRVEQNTCANYGNVSKKITSFDYCNYFVVRENTDSFVFNQYCTLNYKYQNDLKLVNEKKLAIEKKLAKAKRIAKEKRLADEKMENEIKKIAEEKRIVELIRFKKEKFAIAEEEFGLTCEWFKWNKKGSSDYNNCINNYALSETERLLQKEIKLSEIKKQDELANIEKKEQEKKLRELEFQMNELDRLYGSTCKAMGLNKKDDEYPSCMIEMMKIEEDKQQRIMETELAMAQIKLQQAQLESQNRAMELRLAEIEKNNDLIREANISSQKAEDNRIRQQQALLKQQLALEEKKVRQQGFMNGLMLWQSSQPKPMSNGISMPRSTRTTCSWQYGQFVCNSR